MDKYEVIFLHIFFPKNALAKNLQMPGSSSSSKGNSLLKTNVIKRFIRINSKIDKTIKSSKVMKINATSPSISVY